MSTRPEILLLTHRIPYPPNKGDKIRSWRLLRHLAERYDVHLGCFVDDPDDVEHIGTVRAICKTAYFERLNPSVAKLRSLTGLATGEALSLAYYQTQAMRDFVVRTRTAGLAAEVAFSSSMAPYIAPSVGSPAGEGAVRLVDLCDCDAEKWRQYAARQKGPMALVYGREGKRLKQSEDEIIAWADASFAISDSEARVLAPDGAKVYWYGNGVDTDYFNPDETYEKLSSPPDVVFIGMMDYWANIDAAAWFAKTCWPKVRAAAPEATFAIVGARPAPSILKLNGQAGVTVTGRVEDVRPWLAHAKLVVAPMRIARGVQNKVLEAMAMGKTVVATGDAIEGVNAAPGEDIVRADNADGMAQEILTLMAAPARAADIGARARARVRDEYSWSAQLARFDAVAAPLIDGAAARSRARPALTL